MNIRDYRDDSDAFDDHRVLWRWTPGPEARNRLWDVANEYAVLEVEGDSGVMLMGRYGGRWLANPPSARPVIAELLRRAGDAGKPDPDCIRCDGEGIEVCGRHPNRWEHALGAKCDNPLCDGGMEPCACTKPARTDAGEGVGS